VSGTPRSFAQGTLDGRIAFPTFGTQSLQVDGHVVVSWAGEPVSTVIPFPGTPGIEQRGAPRQRWAYIGGWGSIPTLGLLERGGDELIFLDGRYNVPIDRVQLPFIGPPVVSLRSILAGADVQRWPSLAQAVGIRLAVSSIYGEWLVDPANRHNFFRVGLSIVR
jgi:hypothetical protein